MMDYMGHFGWGMGFCWVFMLLFWVLVILAIVALVKWLAGSMSTKAGTEEMTPREILERRYARGEISREEYERMKRDLQS